MTEIHRDPLSRRWLSALLCVLACGLLAAPAAPAATSAGGASQETLDTSESSSSDDDEGSSSSSSIRTLKSGSRGSRVRALQRRLKVDVTGVYDKETARAVRRFQKRRDLTVDGIAGPQTLRALGLVSKSTSKIRPSVPVADVDLPDRIPSKAMAILDEIAECESGGRPDARSPDGTYRGKYQFHIDTWAGVGGSSDPAKASESEQDKRAYLLYDREGVDPWPVCGPKAKRAVARD